MCGPLHSVESARPTPSHAQRRQQRGAAHHTLCVCVCGSLWRRSLFEWRLGIFPDYPSVSAATPQRFEGYEFAISTSSPRIHHDDQDPCALRLYAKRDHLLQAGELTLQVRPRHSVSARDLLCPQISAPTCLSSGQKAETSASDSPFGGKSCVHVVIILPISSKIPPTVTPVHRRS